MNCKDEKCGIRGGNMTRAQKLKYAPDNSGIQLTPSFIGKIPDKLWHGEHPGICGRNIAVPQKFAIGETVYMEQKNRKEIENNKIPLIPILIQSTFVTE